MSTGGEELGLYAPDGTPQHKQVYYGQIQNVSTGLYPDGNTNALFFMWNWTPRAPNQTDGPASPLLSNLVINSNNTVTLSFSTIVGRTYRVEFKETLDDLLWQPLADRTATGAVTTVNDSVVGHTQRFYRVALLQ